MKVLLDEGLPARAAGALRDVGWDAVHVGEIGMSATADHNILRLALDEGRIVVTLDNDYPQMLALTNAARPSVVLIRQQHIDAPVLVQILTSLRTSAAADLATGCIITVGRKGCRTRMLPIRADYPPEP